MTAKNENKTVTLHCELGDHSWERVSQRGRRPRSCPTCLEQAEVPTTDAEKQAAAEARAAERKEQRYAEALARVEAFRAWVKADAEVTRRRNNGEKVARVPMPELPASHDYTLIGQAATVS